MKARLTMRAALALGLAPVARDIARARRLARALPAQASREVAQGNILAAAFLVGLHVLGL